MLTADNRLNPVVPFILSRIEGGEYIDRNLVPLNFSATSTNAQSILKCPYVKLDHNIGLERAMKPDSGREFGIT